MATQQHPMVNGVDVDRLSETIETLRSQPDLARFQFRAHHRWLDGPHACTRIDDFSGAGREDVHTRTFLVESSEPHVLLGNDEAPSATEAVLHALSSCLSATFVYHAAAKGIEIDELEVDMEGDLDVRGFLGLSDEVRNGFEQIRATFHVKSDASDAQLRELVELAQRRSPVFDVVTHPVPVSVELERR